MNYVRIVTCFILSLSCLQTAFAISPGDKIEYSITVNNTSANAIKADNKNINPRQTNVTVAKYTDVANASTYNIAHQVKITDQNNAEICTVTGHIDFTARGMSMYAENSNPERCEKSNGMFDNGFGLIVTVK